MGAGSVPVVEGVSRTVAGSQDARASPEPWLAEAVRAAAAYAAPGYVHVAANIPLTALPVQLMHLDLHFAKDAFSRVAAWYENTSNL